MSRYTVTAERGTRTWVLQCQEFPAALSEVVRLDQTDVIREAIAFVAGVTEDSVEYDLVPAVDPQALSHLAASRELRKRGARLTADAADELTRAAETLQASGLTVRDIGYILDVSYQRAHQLVTRPLNASTKAPIDIERAELI
jgi:hypothetical protein